MLFKRYASPFLFLDILIENKRFTEGIDEIQRFKAEDRYWELYLASMPFVEQSYDDWRKGSNKSSVQSDNTPTKTEIETAINQSKNILSNFNPLK